MSPQKRHLKTLGMMMTSETTTETNIFVRCLRKQYRLAMGLIGLGLVFLQVFYDVFGYVKSLKRVVVKGDE